MVITYKFVGNIICRILWMSLELVDIGKGFSANMLLHRTALHHRLTARVSNGSCTIYMKDIHISSVWVLMTMKSERGGVKYAILPGMLTLSISRNCLAVTVAGLLWIWLMYMSVEMFSYHYYIALSTYSEKAFTPASMQSTLYSWRWTINNCQVILIIPLAGPWWG